MFSRDSRDEKYIDVCIEISIVNTVYIKTNTPDTNNYVQYVFFFFSDKRNQLFTRKVILFENILFNDLSNICTKNKLNFEKSYRTQVCWKRRKPCCSLFIFSVYKFFEMKITFRRLIYTKTATIYIYIYFPIWDWRSQTVVFMTRLFYSQKKKNNNQIGFF